MIDFLLETLQVLLLFLWYAVEALVVCFIPAKWRHKDVSNDTVLITGAAMGIGRIMTQRFAKLGSRLVLWDLDAAGLQSIADEVKEMGIDVRTYVVDLSDRAATQDTAAKVKREVGEIDILINNAGIVSGKTVLEVSDALIEKTMQVNTMSHFWTVRAFLDGMLKRNHGHVVTIASSAGCFGVSGLVDYCASKFAAVGLTEALSLELLKRGADGVHTTTVCPFVMDTGMFKGFQTRFPRVLPLLKPEACVDRIMDGILTNERRVFLPATVRLLFAIRGILTVKQGDLLSKYFGICDCMDAFQGRQKKD